MNMSDSTPEFTITRVLNASRELVWRAWTEKRELAGWLPSTPPETISFDVREGGRYRYIMVNAETGEEYPTGGVFLEVVPFERLAFTWGYPDAPIEDSPVVTLTLTSQGDRTEMIFHLRGCAGQPGDKYYYDGWSNTLDDLAKHLHAPDVHPPVQPLFTPITIGKLTLPNRIVMAPMTRTFSPNGIPGADVAQYYRRRAENGVGLIITEGTVVNHPSAADHPNVPHFYGPALEGWSAVVEQVHAAGGRIFPQLWHVGMARKVGNPPNPESLPIGPSGIDLTGNRITEPMTQSDIDSVIEAFAQAAADAKSLGFDGIEIHGAHGYLIDQFFWQQTNKRTDRYGGDSVEGRTRFAVEIVRAIRKAVGPDYPIALRISQWKSSNYSAKLAETPEELASFLEPLTAAGVDIYHCSTRRFWEPEFEGSDLNLAGWVKSLTGRPTMTVGAVGLNEVFTNTFAPGQATETTGLDGLIERLERKEFDLVAVGRSLLVDPEWAMKIRSGRFDERTPFTAEALGTLY